LRLQPLASSVVNITEDSDEEVEDVCMMDAEKAEEERLIVQTNICKKANMIKSKLYFNIKDFVAGFDSTQKYSGYAKEIL